MSFSRSNSVYLLSGVSYELCLISSCVHSCVCGWVCSWVRVHVHVCVTRYMDCKYACLCMGCSQVVGLSVEGHVVQVHVDVWVVLVAHPADGRAVERGAWADVGLQGGQRLGLLDRVNLWEFEGQHLGCLIVAAKWQRRPAGEKGEVVVRRGLDAKIWGTFHSNFQVKSLLLVP